MSNKAIYDISDRSSSLYLKILAELMSRSFSTNPKLGLKETICLSTAYIHNGISARFFAIIKDRKAWIVPAYDSKQIIVWFSDEGSHPNWKFDVSFSKEEGNVIPNPLRCHSAYFDHVSDALNAIEDYILEDKLPENVLQPGHLQYLTGE
jgi:hypothetical protein